MRLRVQGVIRNLAISVKNLAAVSVIALCVISCAQGPSTADDETDKTVINPSDISEETPGVTTHTEEELRRTGETDTAKALKKRDPRIN
ncbi:MAG: hypothetical protein ACR2QU_06510 [Gammaproteobacteria bacterium]